VTTGAAGSSASVTNVGSSSAAVFDFTIPAGAAGAAGATGPQGPAGPAGTTSWNGITDKPATFPPSTHTHTASDIADFSTAVDAKLSTQTANVSFAGITMYDGPGSGGGMQIGYQWIDGITRISFAFGGGTQTTAWTGSAGDITSGTLSASRLPSSGVTAGTYTSVTVDATGRVTGGTNPSSGGKPLGLILALT
jgi:hypothetical protein